MTGRGGKDTSLVLRIKDMVMAHFKTLTYLGDPDYEMAAWDSASRIAHDSLVADDTRVLYRLAWR